jgi:CRP/FNR family transcriptional regulator, nitrogen oxide reductase regulator
LSVTFLLRFVSCRLQSKSTFVFDIDQHSALTKITAVCTEVIVSSHKIDLHDALSQNSLFAGLPADALRPLIDGGHVRKVAMNDLIFRQGEPANTFYMVLAGKVRLVQHTADGKDVTMSTFSAGDVVGLVVAVTGEAYPGSAEALDSVEVVALDGAIMWRLMNDHATLAVRVLRLTAARLHEAHDRIRELSAERVQQRIARSLLRLAQKVGVKESNGAIRLNIRMSRQDIAQMNGTTLETVSRTLTAWERDGIIDAGREHISILKAHTLVAIAEDIQA